MATLIDPEQATDQEHEGAVDNSKTDTREELFDEVPLTDEEVEATPEVTSEDTEEDDLPEKYKGKTRAEIARMHTEAEKAIGRQSSEVGELRAAFDEFVTSSVKAKDEPKVEEDVDFFIDPEAAVKRAIDNHPKLKQAEAVTAEMQKRQSLARLKTDFPDMEKTLAEPAFAEWVKASPVRVRLYQNADKTYDYDSAAELFNNWAERANIVEQTKVTEKQAQSNEVRKASTGNTRSNPDARRTKKVYRRSDIIRMMRTDPERYASMEEEIQLAYLEKRVK